MTSSIFEDYLKKWDLELVKEKRKILLLIDNCPAHPPVNLHSIEIAFLPPNTTSVLQLMDQGVIWNLKQMYRKQVLLRIMEMQENHDKSVISLLDAVNLLNLAWNSVSSKTIHNCFAHCGLIKPSLTRVEDRTEYDPQDDIPLSEWLQINRLMDINKFEEYVNIDKEIHTTQELTDQEIVTEIQDAGEHLNQEDIDCEHDDAEEQTITSAQALKCTRQLHRYFQSEGANEEIYLYLNKL